MEPSPDELTDDAIAGSFRIWQRRRGHRYSIDDVLTAWEAVNAMPHARRYADLGCGIGSVLLMVAYKLHHATIAAIEAQEQSIALARRNLARNDVDAHLVHGDLRAADLHDLLGGPFELVTGTPPYLPPDRGSPSTDAQRTYARLEMRGGVEAYVEAAARILAPRGRFVVCCDARRPERVIGSAALHGLHPRLRRDVIPRAGHKGALFAVWTLGREPGELTIAEPFVARDEHGGRTAEAHAIRRFFDLPVNEAEPASPGKER